MTLSTIARYTGEVLLMILAASFTFDCIHWLLHRWMRQGPPVFRFFGSLHAVHHRFLDTGLVLHDELTVPNIVQHHIPELVTQLAVCSLFYVVLQPLPVLATQIVLLIVFAVVMSMRGLDPNHTPLDVVPSPRSGVRVEAAYHLLHHVFPDRYMSSYVPLFDRLFGTGCQLAGRRYVVTGASGAFGQPLCEMLDAEGAAHVTKLRHGVDWTYDDDSTQNRALDAVFAQADVLVLTHGSKLAHAMDANCTSFVALIERFKRATADRRLPVEVWAVGSEIEAHPAFGNADLRVYLESKRAFAKHAWRYYRDPSITYRHIVPSAFTSPMGPGLITGRAAAAIALFFIRRGFRYVPVTYTGIAALNYFKFLLPWGQAEKPVDSVDRVAA